MATFGQSADLHGARFLDTDLRGARFVGANLSGAVLRGVDIQNVEIDAPRLSDGESFLRVNGVDVVPLVEAELDRRLPGRARQRWALLAGRVTAPRETGGGRADGGGQ